MSESMHSDAEVEDLDYLQPAPRHIQVKQEELEYDPFHDDASPSASDSDSDDEVEVEALDDLRVGQINAQNLSDRVRESFLVDDGTQISKKFIDSRYPLRSSTRYPLRSFTRIKAAPGLSDMFSKLEPTLPLHPDVIGDGLNQVEGLLNRGLRLQYSKPHCVKVVKIVMNLWKDVVDHPKLSKQYSAPGTTANVLLSLVHGCLLLFRSRLLSHGESSLVNRSRRRKYHQAALAKSVKDIRRVVMDSRKKFGMADKIHRIAAGLPELEDRPTMTVPSVVESLKRTINNVLQRFRVQHLWISLGLEYPNVNALHPTFAFLRQINLEIYKPDASRKRKHGDEDGEGSSADAQQTKTDKAKSQLISMLQSETNASWFHFKDVIHLTKWKDNTRRRVRKWWKHVNNLETILSDPDHHLIIQRVLVLILQLNFHDSARVVAELLVVVYREAYERDPSDRTKTKNLCAALGALSTVLTRTYWYLDRHLDAVKAAEEGIQLVMPLYLKQRSGSKMLYGSLQLALSNALFALLEHNANDAQQLFLGCRSWMAADLAIVTFRQVVSVHPQSMHCKEGLAQALQRQASTALFLLGRFSALKDKHGAISLDKFHWKTLPKCCAIFSTIQEALFVHGSLEDNLSERIESHLTNIKGEAIQIYRELAALKPIAYDPLLADVLEWKATTFKSNVEESLGAYEEGQKVFARLIEAWPNHFSRKAAQFHAKYALQLRLKAQYHKAAEALSTAIENQTAITQQPKAWTLWRGFNMVASLASCHALVLSQLDRYVEAFEEAQRAETVFYDVPAMNHPRTKVFLAEPIAVKGFAEWMLDRPQDALRTLRQSLKLLEDYEALNVDKDKKKKKNGEPLKTDCVLNPVYVLASGWKAGVEASLGDPERAQGNINKAIEQARALLCSKPAQRTAELYTDPIDHILPHLLVISAAILLERKCVDEAFACVEESLELGEEGRKCSPTTYKTALLVKKRLLELTERPYEAAVYAFKADLLPGTGFMDKVQCCTLYDHDTTLSCYERMT
ncbi:hypothetical protein CF327_g2982 [Tilletia walkeri]|nr:hypothetical protein CF327_g2982 [Tilletia walkeri]